MSLRTGSLALGLLLVLAVAPGCAHDPSPTALQRKMMEPARDAERRGDLGTAFDQYRRAAESGIAMAQLRLGRMYQQGTGTAQDDAQAVRWYRAAADQGYPPAQIALAKMYEQGRGVAQDHAAALVWYHRAAEHERSYAYRVSPPRVPAEAHARAGQMIESGHGVRADPAVAAWYYEVAAEAGNVDARFALAELYRKGKGVAADPATAERWYAAAAAGYARPAEAGDARAQDRLGQMYVDGRGVPKDVARGIALLERAAGQGRSSAQTRLARLFEQGGDGLTADPARAAVYTQMAAAGA